MKKTRKMLILCVFMCICLISTAAYAALKIEVKVNMSGLDFRPGEKLVVTVSTNSVTGTSKGVFAVDGYVEYDTNVFETLKIEDFVVNGQIAFNPETGKFAIDLDEEILNQAELFKVSLTIKENAEAGVYATAVSLKDIEMFTMDQGSCIVNTPLGIKVLGEVNNENVPVENNTVENNTVFVKSQKHGENNTWHLGVGS